MSCDLRRRHLYELKKSTVEEESKYTYVKPIHNSVWAVGMTVAHRSRPTVKQTVQSLAEAGWGSPILFAEPGANDLPDNQLVLWNKTVLGNWGNFCNRLRQLVRMRADKILLVQDDVEFLPNTRQWLESNWPCNEGIVTLYRPASYVKAVTESPNSVYDILSLGRPFLGMLAVAMSMEHAQSLVLNLDAMADPNPAQDDLKFGRYVHSLRIPVNIVRKSRCQHIGATSSIYPHTKSISKTRQADTYER